MKTQIEQILGTNICNNVSNNINSYGYKSEKKTKNIYHEFEFIFSERISRVTYIRLVNYLKNLSMQRNFEILQLTYIDINMLLNEDKYRITTDSITGISNEIILYNLLNGENKIMKKTQINNISIDEFNIKARLSIENENVDKNILINNIDKMVISYRKKNKIKLIINKTDNFTISIELSEVRTSNNYTNLNAVDLKYDLEIEYLYTHDYYIDVIKPNGKFATNEIMLWKILNNVIQYIGYSNNIITKNESNDVINFYQKITGVSKNRNRLVYRKPVALTLNDICNESIAIGYLVTDKADGERCFAIVCDGKVYLITDGMIVINTNISVSPINEGRIFDCELITKSDGKRVVLIFDCITSGLVNIEKEVNILNRLMIAEEFCNEIDGHKMKNEKVKNESDEEKIMSYYRKLNSIISKSTDFAFSTKFKYVTYGINKSDIFKYAHMIYSYYNHNEMPYTLDGLIFHPIEQDYETDIRLSKRKEYKWKPSEHNSIDFYVEIKKNSDGSDDIIVNNIDDQMKTYKILYLYVGRYSGDKYNKYSFDLNDGCNYAMLEIKNNQIVDELGNIINDKYIVEFSYINDITIDSPKRWIPLRVRYDKMEDMDRSKSNFGNNYDTAVNNWDTIKVNILKLEDFNDLYRSYDTKLNYFRNRIYGITESKEESKKNTYYTGDKDIAKSMKFFHNFIKSTLIDVLCNEKHFDKQITVLDYGCGRGGDMSKYYHSNVSLYVGVDINKHNLVIDGGAISRYESEKKKKGNKYPKMVFINASPSVPLNVKDQMTFIKSIDKSDEKLIKEYLVKKYDRISCQFAIHYFLENDDTWSNFKLNVNNNLNDDGYLFFTCFDGRSVYNDLLSNDQIIEKYTDENGIEQILFKIEKHYTNLTDVHTPIRTGFKIGLYVPWMFSDNNIEYEYLVDDTFIIDDLKNSCGLQLYETGMFHDMYNVYHDFFTTTNFDKTDDKILKNAKMFYTDNSDMNIKSRKYNDYMRYYIFHKNIDTEKLSRIDDDYTFFTSLNMILNKCKCKNKIESLNLISDDDLQDSDIENIVEHIDKFNLIISIKNRNKNNAVVFKNKKSKGYIILNKSNNKYAPVFKKMDGGTQCIFKLSDDVVKKNIDI